MKFKTYAKPNWCPACPDYLIWKGFDDTLSQLESEGLNIKDVVVVAGIGCHGKIFDYLNLNSFYGLHGRALASAQGIKLANPNLKVICFVGDGDTYNEGIEHLIFAAKRNADIKVFVHDNRTFALTVCQYTGTSPKGFKGSSTPEGSLDEPFNPLEIVISAGATFVARTFTGHFDHMKKIMREAILHKGFAFVEILQPCITFFDMTPIYKERTYIFESENLESKEKALEKIKEWDYKNGSKIPIGIFYKIRKPTLEEEFFKSSQF
jgi:2-oxoglutarate ferredoxin oxidoreductase subunit beta